MFPMILMRRSFIMSQTKPQYINLCAGALLLCFIECFKWRVKRNSSDIESRKKDILYKLEDVKKIRERILLLEWIFVFNGLNFIEW